MPNKDKGGLEPKEWRNISYKVPPHLVEPLSEVIEVAYGGVMANYVTHIITRDLMFRIGGGLKRQENPELEKYIREIVQDEIAAEVAALFTIMKEKKRVE